MPETQNAVCTPKIDASNANASLEESKAFYLTLTRERKTGRFDREYIDHDNEE